MLGCLGPHACMPARPRPRRLKDVKDVFSGSCLSCFRQEFPICYPVPCTHRMRASKTVYFALVSSCVLVPCIPCAWCLSVALTPMPTRHYVFQPLAELYGGCMVVLKVSWCGIIAGGHEHPLLRHVGEDLRDLQPREDLKTHTKPLAPPYSLHTVLLKVGSCNDTGHGLLRLLAHLRLAAGVRAAGPPRPQPSI